jgi:hypothetical protein
MISSMHSPVSLGYEWDDTTLYTPKSRFLVQRMDWSDAIPYKSLGAFDRRACLATYQYMLGVHTRNMAIKMRKLPKVEEARFLKFLPLFTAPVYADLLDSMAIFVYFFGTVARSALAFPLFERVKNFVYDLTETIVRANASILGEDPDTSRRMIHRMMIIEGGFHVPEAWFDMDDARLKHLIKTWIERFRVTMG